MIQEFASYENFDKSKSLLDKKPGLNFSGHKRRINLELMESSNIIKKTSQ